MKDEVIFVDKICRGEAEAAEADVPVVPTSGMAAVLLAEIQSRNRARDENSLMKHHLATLVCLIQRVRAKRTKIFSTVKCLPLLGLN